VSTATPPERNLVQEVSAFLLSALSFKNTLQK